MGKQIVTKTDFPADGGLGTIWTVGRHALGLPELCTLNVVPSLREVAYDVLSELAEDSTVTKNIVVPLGDRMMYAAYLMPKSSSKPLIQTTLQGCDADARILRFKAVAPKEAFMNAETDAKVLREAQELVKPALGETPCDDCYVPLTVFVDDDPVNPGIRVTTNGFRKEHADGTTHKMSGAEYTYDCSAYDDPFAVVPNGAKGLLRCEAADETVMGKIQAVLATRYKDKDVELQPTEVRAGDTTVSWVEGGFMISTVLAVHAGNRGVIVAQDECWGPSRIPIETVLGSVHGPHW